MKQSILSFRGTMDCFASARNDGDGAHGLSVVFACDKRNAFAHGSNATKQSILSFRGTMDCFAGARNDGLSR
jgi:hypothetical protein